MSKQIRVKSKNLKPLILVIGILSISLAIIAIIFSIFANLRFVEKIKIVSKKTIYNAAYPIGILSTILFVLVLVFTILFKLNPKSNVGLNWKILIISSITLVSLLFVISMVGILWLLNDNLFKEDEEFVPCYLWLMCGILALPVSILNFIAFSKIKTKKSK